jgi:hypothetical protein
VIVKGDIYLCIYLVQQEDVVVMEISINESITTVVIICIFLPRPISNVEDAMFLVIENNGFSNAIYIREKMCGEKRIEVNLIMP